MSFCCGQPVNARESNKIRLKFFNAFILMQIIVYYFVFSELGCYADEYLEIDARHGTGQYGKVFFIEQVVDAAL